MGPDAEADRDTNAEAGSDTGAGQDAEVGQGANAEAGRDTGGGHLGVTGEYRIAHLEERLARGDLAELSMRIEARGDSVHITGTASTAADREAILRIAAEELPGVAVLADITLADVSAPDRPEELS
ncbi:hypothetical protein ACWD4G_31040 [Streptomyces sp. NPDC002643]